jgi:hypothetical protein
MPELLEPKNIIITDNKGESREYIISKFPAWQGREIMESLGVNILMNLLPKFANRELLKQTRSELMTYVAVNIGGNVTRLTTPDLINNHIGDWEALQKLEWEMMVYNCSFFQDGRILSFLIDCAQVHIPQAIKILTDSLAQSSPAAKQPYTN